MAIYLNDVEIKPTIFPDGTSQIWKIPEDIKNANNLSVHWKFENEAELFHLYQLSQLLNCINNRILHIPYLPYARQDKDISNDTTFALYPFTKILNMCCFDKVIITDPHSNKSLKLIKNSIAVFPEKEVFKTFHDLNHDWVCYPDKGAKEKYKHIYDLPFISAYKERNQLTGNILSINVYGDCKDKTILIVDDICDAGGTFILLAKQLKEKGAKEVNLFVTHGLFTKGLQVLKDNGINRIFTADGEKTV